MADERSIEDIRTRWAEIARQSAPGMLVCMLRAARLTILAYAEGDIARLLAEHTRLSDLLAAHVEAGRAATLEMAGELSDEKARGNRFAAAYQQLGRLCGEGEMESAGEAVERVVAERDRLLAEVERLTLASGVRDMLDDLVRVQVAASQREHCRISRERDAARAEAARLRAGIEEIRALCLDPQSYRPGTPERDWPADRLDALLDHPHESPAPAGAETGEEG